MIYQIIIKCIDLTTIIAYVDLNKSNNIYKLNNYREIGGVVLWYYL